MSVQAGMVERQDRNEAVAVWRGDTTLLLIRVVDGDVPLSGGVSRHRAVSWV